MFGIRSVFLCIAALLLLVVKHQVVEGAALSYGEHRPVYVDVEFVALESIDGPDQTFTADFFLTAIYQDNKVNLTGTSPDVELDSSVPYDAIDFEFINSHSVTTQYKLVYASAEKPEQVGHFAGTVADIPGMPWIREDERIQGVFKVALGLQDFPFDHQMISLELESSSHPIELAEFVLDPSSNMIDLLESTLEWTLEGSKRVQKTEHYHIFNETYDRVDFQVLLKRRPDYYMDKIVTGVCLLVVMSWLLFTFDSMDSNRHTTSATLYLAVVTFLFIVTGDAPKVPYSTRLGKFITLSISELFFSYAFFCIFTAVTRHANSSKEHAIKERRRERRKLLFRRVRVGGKDPTTALGLAESPQEGETAVAIEQDGDGDRSTPPGPSAYQQQTLPLDESTFTNPEGEAREESAKEWNEDSDDEDDDEDVSGWWDAWDSIIVPLEVGAATLLIIVYVIATPLLLRHTETVL